MEDESQTKKSLWDSLFGAAKEVIEKGKEAIYKRKLRRKFEAAYDDSITKIEDAMAEKRKIQEQLQDMDINALLKQRAKIEEAEQIQKILKEEYFEMFGEELKVRE